MTTLQWFTCLFAYNFNFEVLQRLWDLIFLKGNKIMFRIALAIFHLLEHSLLQCDSIAQILKCMETISSLLQDPHIVLQIANMPQYKIKQSQINRMRIAYRGGVIAEIEKYRVKPNADFAKLPYTDESIARKFDLASFLTRIPLYKGIQ